MKNDSVNLCDPKQIAKKGYTGCKTTKTVVSFAKKYGVPCCWYKPKNGPRMLLVEMNQFGTTFKQVKSGAWTNNSTNTSSNNSSNTRASGSNTNNWNLKTTGGAKRTSTTTKAKTNANRTGGATNNRWNNGAKKMTSKNTSKNTAKNTNARTTTNYGIRKMTASSRRTNANSGRIRRAA